MKKMKRCYTITLNRSKKTYTIRRYDKGKLTAKYRSLPQGDEFSEHWTTSDIIYYLQHGDDYYMVK